MNEELKGERSKPFKTWNFAKRMVSLEKHRFQWDGYDLDLSYITRNIIAMGFPSIGAEGVYRNHMQDVKRFFREKHSDRVRVYNLCTERAYDMSSFKSCCHRYKFDDHQPPPFIYMLEFCKDVDGAVIMHTTIPTSVKSDTNASTTVLAIDAEIKPAAGP